MKKFVLITVIILPLLAIAQHGHDGAAADKPSIHGMLIFGKEKIYASHLPLFHTPHDYQIILELELSAPDQKKFITDQRLHPEFTTYIIEPEKFILPDMIAKPRPFTVNLYRGYFERGGIKIASNISVKIKQVIFFKKFKAEENKSTTADYILIGNDKEQFLIHHITSKPDFEQIIQVKTKPGAFVRNASYALVTLHTNANNPVGVSGQYSRS